MQAPSGMASISGDPLGQVPPAWAGRNADRAVTALYLRHYRPMVRLAARLVRDLATAEEIVQDSFVAAHAAWRRRPDADRALPDLRRSVPDLRRSVPDLPRSVVDLRRSVVDRARSARRHRAAVDKLAPGLVPALVPDQRAARQRPGPAVERSAFISALWALPARQREDVVLRYFADLPGTFRRDDI